MKNSCIIILMTLGTTTLKSQQFSLYGKVNDVRQDEVTSTSQYDSYGYSILDLVDSTYIRTHYLVTNTSKKIYSPKIGYEAGANIVFQLSNRFSVRTGIGLNYLALNIQSQFIDSKSEVLSVDTITPEHSDPIIHVIFNTCDTFLNSYSDLGPMQKGINQSLLNLKIPLELEYDLLPDKLFIRGGAFLQTPILSATQEEYGTIQSEVVDGKKICKYVKIVDRNTSGNSLNHLQFGVMASLSYALFNQFNVDLGVSQDLSNTFAKEEYQIYPVNNNQFKPLKFSAGIEFKFGNHISHFDSAQ